MMHSGTPARTLSTKRKPDIYDNTFGSQDTLATTTFGSTSTCNALSPAEMALNPLVAQSNQPRLDSYSAVATPTFYTANRNLLPADLLLGHPQVWECPVPPFEGVDNGTFMIQDYATDTDFTLSQLVNSHFHRPHIDLGSNQEPPLRYNNQPTIPVSIIDSVYPKWVSKKPGNIRIHYPLTPSFQVCSAGTPTEISQEGGHISTEVAPEVYTSHDTPFNAPFQSIRPPATSRAVPSQPSLPHHTPVPKERSYDRPGKKPAARFQPDPLKLKEYCRQAEGSAFAVDWIIPTFMHGVTKDALLRYLKSKEIDEMDFTGGFEPHQAYDGFISKVGNRYECGLCKESKRTWWKNKKDAPRHLRKFHFGLADVCKDCGKAVFSKAEMKTHHCEARPGRPSSGV